MNLLMNQQQQSQMVNFQNYNQFMGNQNIQNKNSVINYPSPQNLNQLNFNNRGLIQNNMNLNNIQNYNMNLPNKNKYMTQNQNEGGFIPNNIQMQMMNNNMGMTTNFTQISLEQLIHRANSTFPGKFFVIKSIDESNILSSIRFKIWCSTIKGNQKLQKAYKEADKKYPIILFFSVNGSGKFMGIALMNSDVEYKVNFNYWSQNDKWKGFFFVEWICIKDVPNRMFRTIINDLNENKPVTSSRDTQEICTSAGVKMLKIFKDYPQESTIFDSQTNDFNQNSFLSSLNERNNMNMMNNIGNIGNMGNVSNMNKMNNLNNMNNMNNMNNLNNMDNINNMNNLSNMNNMNNMNNLNNLSNVGNMGNMNNMGNNANIMANLGNFGNNMGKYNQLMKMNANSRNIDNIYNNNTNNMRENNINLVAMNNPHNIGMGNNPNVLPKIQMEMNTQDNKNNNNTDDKNNINEQYDFNNILARKNDEDEGEDEDK